MILAFPINAFTAMKNRKYQQKIMVIKDKRVKLITEMLNGMRVIKLYGWEESFQKLIDDVRDEELRLLKRSAYLRAATALVWMWMPFFVSFASFMMYILLGNDFNAALAFQSMAFFNILQFPMFPLPQVISSIVEASVSVQRVTKFLLHPE